MVNLNLRKKAPTAQRSTEKLIPSPLKKKIIKNDDIPNGAITSGFIQTPSLTLLISFILKKPNAFENFKIFKQNLKTQPVRVFKETMRYESEYKKNSHPKA